MKIKGQIVDLYKQRIFQGEILVEDGKIKSIVEKKHDVKDFIMPGFIDAHIHIESSMLVPSVQYIPSCSFPTTTRSIASDCSIYCNLSCF